MQQQPLEGFRLSHQQQRLWQLQQESSAYRAQCALLIEGPLKSVALKEALQNIVKRHEILRTAFRFLPSMDMPVQVIVEDSTIALHEVDLRQCNEEEQKKRLEEYLRKDQEKEFDYEQGKVLNASLVALREHKHVLVLNLSAMCVDEASLSKFVGELVEQYEACVAGILQIRETVQYVDFSEWQYELLESNEEAAGREFWEQEQLLTPPPLRLPGERSQASSFASYQPEVFTVTVEAELAGRLTALTSEESSTPATVLLACWQSLLWRLTAEPEVLVQTRFDIGKYDDLDESLGLFTKYLPLRCQFEEDASFKDVVRNVDAASRNAYEWQEYYTPRLPRDARVNNEESTSHSIGFEYQTEEHKYRGTSLIFTLINIHKCTEYFKLQLSIIQTTDTLRLSFHYDPRSFTATSIERLAAQYQALLSAALATPEAPLQGLALLGAAEREQLLVEWQGRETAFPQDRCFHQLFEAQVERMPHHIAVICEADGMSYAELNARANQVAHQLCEFGVGPEVLVGILMERSVEMVVAVLGVLKAGGAYVPLDPQYPQERISFMLADARVAVLLTQQSLIEKVSGLGAEVLALDAEWETISQQSVANPDNVAKPENLAYVIYTSGSTGQPKGVMIEHRSVLNLCTALEQEIYGVHEGLQRVSVNAPLSFDASVKQLVQLGQGRTLCLVPEWVRRDGAALREYLVRQQVEVLDCTPAQLRLLLGARESDSSTGSGHSSLPQVVLVGGEAIDAGLWSQLGTDSKTAYYNLYGPTECTVDATVARITAAVEQPTIGRALPNTQLLILDGQQQLAPIGVAGELCIGGAGVARGYLHREQLTQEKFISHPWGREAGARLYRTGDLGRYLEDGTIEYLGRLDRQVKLRGYRVELGEIEAVIAGHPEVRECAVLAREDEVGDQRLVAYIVGRREASGESEGQARYRLPNGLRIAHRNHNETAYLYEEIFTKQSYLRHGIRLPEGACVFDVGANIGMFTLFVREQCPSARVYAFEPVGELCATLRVNSRLAGGEVKVYDYGLGEQEEEVEFTYYQRYTMMSGQKAYANAESEVAVIRSYLRQEQEHGSEGAGQLLAHAEELLAGRFEGRSEQCRLRRLSAVLREEAVEEITLLKVDVQRAELAVLRGIDEEQWEKIRQVVMEVHDEEGGASEGRCGELRRMLEERGYQVVIEQDELLAGTDRYNLYAVQSGWDGQVSWRGTAGSTSEAAARGEAGELREYLKRRLPDYMVPTAYVELSKLPLTRHGKVDRAALPQPETSNANLSSDFVAPENEIEQVIASIWRKVLRVEKVSCDKNFFDLGGHSLLIVQVASHLRNTLERDISIIELFKYPTIRSLASHLSQKTVEAVSFERIYERTSRREIAFRRQRQFRHEREKHYERP